MREREWVKEGVAEEEEGERERDFRVLVSESLDHSL